MSGNQQAPDMICEVFVLSPSDLVPEHERGGAEAGPSVRGMRAPGAE